MREDGPKLAFGALSLLLSKIDIAKIVMCLCRTAD